MKKVVPVLAIVLAFTLSSNAQKKKTLDQEAIKDMCGCFEVTFNFTETFNYSNDSLYRPSETKVDKGLEYAFAIEDEDDKISIQHLLQVGRPDSPHIVKHWRQDWLFQNQDFYMYNGDNNWTFEKKSKDDVKGQWTQKVFQVDDSPRYEGSGTWVHVDGKNYWENTTTAPLPRREYTKRSDYNITLRGNRHEITNYGWAHDQDNDKVLRETGKEDVIIAKEKGFNTYKKIDDSRCQASIDWWKVQQDKWASVRAKWADVYGRNKDLTLKEKVDNKVLFKYLLDDDITAEKDINSIIESFVK
ncbi:hypothetical protein ADIWIN_0527 [Winogradskyella psychrotolerans RS-3]|uniref:Uncharacterized protein n=1 Tax=Winogradskyella psychrotolerans RS-3 TaxID=641526 RepID=S7VWD3_9FLAO|nr:DUF6607 family protein [Winogradskyella psychrotolerans]EPR74426.1 hypothetical protein ADIWIN_0527 [Winogradskyella psychrotolerans RS-3]